MTTAIWKSFHTDLKGFIQSRINDKSIAEDILQEVFIKIHSSKNSLDNASKLSSWVYQITRNTIIDYYRKKKLNTSEFNFEVQLPEKVSDTGSDFTPCLKKFIKALPDIYEDVISKTTYGGMSQKTYALENNLSYTTVKSRIQRGRVKLKTLFKACCDIEADVYGNIISSDEKNCDC